MSAPSPRMKKRREPASTLPMTPDGMAVPTGKAWSYLRTPEPSPPRWSAQGNELYYDSSEDYLMAVSVNFQSPAAELSTLRPLFALPARGLNIVSIYEPDPRSDRFLVLTSAGQANTH